MRIPARNPELRALLAGLTDLAAVQVLADFLEERGDPRAVAVRLAPSPAAAMLVIRPKNRSRLTMATFLRYMATVADFKASLDACPDSPRKAALAGMLAEMVSEQRYRVTFDPDSLTPTRLPDIRFVLIGDDPQQPVETTLTELFSEAVMEGPDIARRLRAGRNRKRPA